MQCKARFLPSNKEVLVPEGTTILEAAATAGLVLDIPCGGQGRCGRCLVKVDPGNVTRRENPHLTQKQIEEGWVLSCEATLAGDATVFVPKKEERERIAVASAASRAALPVQCDWPRSPAVRQVFIELPPPTLEDNISDFERLKRALRQKHRVRDVTLSLPLLKVLPQKMREADWKLTVVLDNQEAETHQSRIVAIYPGRSRGVLLGVAVDIGTTNVVIDLVNLHSGKVISRVSSLNKQVTCGEDVISRIIFSEKGKGLETLQHLVVETINELLAELSRNHGFNTSEITEMVVAGNTTMTQLFLGIPSKPIRSEPYIPAATQYPPVTAAEVGVAINPEASVYCLPCVAAYVGGDITAGVLSSCLFKIEDLTIFLDVGTNGEIVLGTSEWLMTCACSAGPAFEGAGVKHGMRAMEGAIEDVKINARTLEPTITVIGNGTPRGLCGSGLIAALAEMFITGVIDRSGHMDVAYVESKAKGKPRARRGDFGAEYVVAWAEESAAGEDIVINEIDINSIIRTKAAIYAGIASMVRSLGISISDVKEVLIGGAFGQHIDIEDAIQIGLLPDLPWEKFKFLGNTSAWGAYNVLLSREAREQAKAIVEKMTYLELIAETSFMDELTAALFLPHTDINRFPSVKALLKRLQPSQQVSPDRQ